MATAIVAPSGQRTTLTMGSDGHLASVTNPANESRTFTYGPGGLLVSEADALGASHHFSYDDTGRLTQDDQPGGGSWTLAQTGTAGNSQVVMTSAEGRTRTHGVQNIT